MILVALINIVDSTYAQSIPNAMPSSSISQQVGISEITVNYRRPNAQGRALRSGTNPFLPNHKLWNTSVSFALNTSFSINDTDLASGKYTISAIPNDEKWKVILKHINAETDVQQEVLQFIVNQDNVPFTETMEVRLCEITDSAALVIIQWGKFALPILIKVPTNTLVLESYKEAINKKTSNHGNTFQYGAWFLLTRGFELPLALEWINMDIQQHETYFNTWLKAQLLRRVNRNTEAINLAQKALDLALLSSDFDFVTYVPRIRKALVYWRNTPDSNLLLEPLFSLSYL